MASNDMNSWDKDPDEWLRQHWQQTFANFKVQAHPSLGDRILNALPAGHQRRRAYRMVCVLVLLSAGLVYPLRLGEPPYAGRTMTTGRPATPIQPLSADRMPLAETSTSRIVPPRSPVNDARPGESVTHQQPAAVNGPAGNERAISRANVLPPSRTIRNRVPANLTGIRSGKGPRLPSPAVLSGAKSLRSVGRPLLAPVAGPGVAAGSDVLAPAGHSVAYSNRLPSTRQSPPSSAADSPASVVPLSWARLKPLDILSLSSQLSALPNQLPLIVSVPLPPVEAVDARRRRQWFVEGLPLTGFQWMRVPSVTSAYLSQVKAPGAFSPATWGYQINGGLRWHYWQAYLSLGQIRRWAYYTVNENRYRVEPRPDNPNQLVRETYAVTENVLLPVAGVGLSRETLLDRGRYAVDLGGQATYLPTDRQSMISLRGGVGRRLAISRAIELQVGLRAEYGLSRFLSEQGHVVIHPLMIGVGLRLQPRTFH